jgi:hypothetical protein
MSVRKAGAILARTVSAVTLLARDDRVPRPLRGIAAIGLLPLPGPIDEVILVLIAPVFLAFYRRPMRDAWATAMRPPGSR